MTTIESQTTEQQVPMQTGTETVSDTTYELQSPQEFAKDFSATVSKLGPGERANLEVMQFEATEDTEPIFDAIRTAHEQGAYTRFHYDRVALRHIRAEAGDSDELSQAYAFLGHNVIKFGDKAALDDASHKRLNLLNDLEKLYITDPAYKWRGQHEHGSHNHIKLAIAGDTAWFGTMNLRGIDFKLSNFMMKINDPRAVKFLEAVFDQSEQAAATYDQEYKIDEDSTLLVDGGRKGESSIYDKASAMIQSLEAGDEFVMISQWPPVRMMYGKLSDSWVDKMETGVHGEFLLPPERDLHFNKKAAHALQTWVKGTEEKVDGMTTINLSRSTHAKALLIKRANGEKEVLFGSHNFTRWTVRNGTRELAIWSKDPEVVAQIEQFLVDAKAE